MRFTLLAQQVPTEDPLLMAAYATAVASAAQVWSTALQDQIASHALSTPSLPGQAPSPSDPDGPPAIAACCKHWLACELVAGNESLVIFYSISSISDSEEGGTPGSIPRSAFNAIVSGQDLLESYMPAFQACFMQGRGRSSMCRCVCVQAHAVGC